MREKSSERLNRTIWDYNVTHGSGGLIEELTKTVQLIPHECEGKDVKMAAHVARAISIDGNRHLGDYLVTLRWPIASWVDRTKRDTAE